MFAKAVTIETKEKTTTTLQSKTKFSTSNQEAKIEHANKNKNNVNNPILSAYENYRHVIVGSSIVGKTYYILEY